MKRSTKLGPYPLLFSNENPAMGVPLHTHYAEVCLTYSIDGEAGFPVFDTTIRGVKEELGRFVSRPFLGKRNEDVALLLFQHFQQWRCLEAQAWKGDYRLLAVELSVKGIQDALGHAEGLATYRVEL